MERIKRQFIRVEKFIDSPNQNSQFKLNDDIDIENFMEKPLIIHTLSTLFARLLQKMGVSQGL